MYEREWHRGIPCGVETARCDGGFGFRGIVFESPYRAWKGPVRQRYLDAVADAEGHAKEVARREIERGERKRRRRCG